MKTKAINIFKLFLVFAVSALTLASCGQPKENPEQVIQKFKEQATKINSADLTAEVAINGSDVQDTMDFTANVGIKFDRRDEENKKADLKGTIGGLMKTADKSVDGDIDFDLLTDNDNYFLRVDKLDTNYEGFAAIQPQIKNYMNKWLKISSDFIPQNLRQLQQKDEASLAKEKQLKELFINTPIFNVTKEYGVESVNGNKVYHYGVQLNKDGVKEYVKKAAVIDGRELTDAEVEDAAKIVSYVSSAELWIGVKDYYLYKATVSMTGETGDNKPAMNLTISMQGADYNKSIDIKTPEDSQEFNPLEILMMYSAANTTATQPADGAVTEQAPADGATTDTATTEPATEEPATDTTTEQPAGN
jgi:hypothetical protein